MLKRVETGSVASALLEARKNTGATQREAAASAGVTSAALSAYEKGVKTPSLAVIVRLADYYDVSLDALLRPERRNQALQTYGDIARHLVKVDEAIGQFHILEDGADKNPSAFLLKFYNSQLREFLKKYKHNQLAIRDFGGGDEMFRAWLSNEFTRLDSIPLDDLSEEVYGAPDSDPVLE